MKWHVECGIGLAFTGIFHFIWHLSYFCKFSGKSEYVDTPYEATARTARQNSINLIIIGFVSSSVQLLLIREIMNIAGGYELITGTFLGSWLIASAAGAAMARRSSLNNIRRINLLFLPWPAGHFAPFINTKQIVPECGRDPFIFFKCNYYTYWLFPLSALFRDLLLSNS